MVSVERQSGPRVTAPETNGKWRRYGADISHHGICELSPVPHNTVNCPRRGRAFAFEDNAHSPCDSVPYKDYNLSTLLHEPYRLV
jgi:hypothetical protein